MSNINQPSGWRKATAGLAVAEQLAQAGERVAVPKTQAFVAVKRVGAHIGLKAGDMMLLDMLDDITPDLGLLGLWAQACRVDLARLTRLSLVSRYPDRSSDWFLEGPGVPVCLCCFDADQMAQRDSYMRSDWRLAEHVACPKHGEMLHCRCPDCSSHLRVSFRMRDGLLRPFCRKCGALLTSRGGRNASPPDAEFAAGVLNLQRQAGGIIRNQPDHCKHLDQAIHTLWSPLDRVDAARPVLALWFDQPGWHCPVEARAAVSTHAPLQHLPVRWRALTLVILEDLFGKDLVADAVVPETAYHLFRRAVPMHPRRHTSAVAKGKNPIDRATGRVQSLSKSPVHRLSGNFLDERADLSRIHP